MLIPRREPDRTEDDWAALTTANQFKALGLYAEYCYSQTDSLSRYRALLRIRSKNQLDIPRIRQLLINSWNTERLLRSTSNNFSGPGSGFVAQWAFPQSYYAAFNSTLASFSALGFTERSHAAVRKKVSDLASHGALLGELNVVIDGGLKDLKTQGISSTIQDFHPSRWNGPDIEEVKRHLISFFRSTRKMHLEDKKPDLKIRTKDGKKLKKSFRYEDWERVSSALGKTSWLCLLYRKRIKSNYRDIDTFLSPRFETEAVLGGLVDFTNVFNLINEINIVNHLGSEELRSWIPTGADFIVERLGYIDKLTTEQVSCGNG
ncbi:MAG: hypothetical protein H8E24_10770 [Verrucomicrobia bacterium]|nr:hypothetical protein [Verrucomicrobiota bacterium]